MLFHLKYVRHFLFYTHIQETNTLKKHSPHSLPEFPMLACLHHEILCVHHLFIHYSPHITKHTQPNTS